MNSSLNIYIIRLSDDRVWHQTTLPVSFGGIGIRSALQLAPSAFMASAASCTPLTRQILPSRLSISSYPEVDLILTQWDPDGDLTPPSSSNKAKQKAWDLPKVQASYEFLVNTSQGPVARARL